MSKKLTIELMQRWAFERGGECLSTTYVNQYTPLRWRCARGHEWSVRPSNIRQGTWCARCVQIKDNVDDMRTLAAARGGRFLSESFSGVRDHYDWECALGHRWRARGINVKRGSWCSSCSRSGIGERICRAYFEQLFEESFPKTRPSWLKNPATGRPLELDGYSECLALAFEHNGRQHYRKTSLFSRGSRFDSIQRRDALKLRLCRERGVRLIVVPELQRITSLVNLRSVIRDQCLSEGVVLLPGFNTRPVDLSGVDAENRLAELQQIAKERGGNLLSEVYLGANKHLKWNCHQGHQWSAMPQHVKNNGSWCPHCWALRRGRRDASGAFLTRDLSA
jgi:hypothetical protein